MSKPARAMRTDGRRRMTGGRAFTLMELVLTIVVVTVLVVAAIAVVNLGGKDIDAVAKVLRSNIQFAQDLAMTNGNPYGFEALSTTTYQIFEGAPGTPARDPLGGGALQVDISPVAFFGSVPTITFMPSGQPSISNDAVINLTDGSRTEQVQVARSTGFVSIAP